MIMRVRIVIVIIIIIIIVIIIIIIIIMWRAVCQDGWFAPRSFHLQCHSHAPHFTFTLI